jgi:hypothetical protein
LCGGAIGLHVCSQLMDTIIGIFREYPAKWRIAGPRTSLGVSKKNYSDIIIV